MPRTCGPLLALLLPLAACSRAADEDGVVTVEGCVDLPSGTTAATVTNALGEAPVHDGCFALRALASGPQLAIATSASDAPLVMGWISVDDPNLDARSTAEVLAWFAAGGPTVTGDATTVLRDALATDAALDPLATAIGTALGSGDDAFAAPHADVAAAVQATVDALLAVPKSSVAPDGPPRSNATLVNPSAALSGVTVTNLSGLQEISFQNAWRRTSFAFVDRVSTFDEDGVETPFPKEIARVDVPTVQALAGGIGTIGQILAGTQDPGGLEHSENVAYVPRTVGPVEVPNAPGAKKTRYRVAVVGPGQSVGDLSELSDAEVAKQTEVTRTFVVREILLPMLTQILLPASDANAYLGSDLAGSAVGDLINVVGSAAPQIWDTAASGDVKGAIRTALDLVVSSGTFRDQILALIADHAFDWRSAESIATSQAAMARAAKFVSVTGALDSALTAVDLVFVGTSLGNANMADVWTVDTIDAIVRLDPVSTTVQPDGEVTLTANVVDAGDDAVFEYRFHTDGAFGSLKNDLHTGNDITASSPVITYVAGSDEGTDTVTVDVYEVKLSERVSVGDASASVEVTKDCDEQQAQSAGLEIAVHVVPYDADTETRFVYFYYLFGAVPDITAYDLVVDTHGEYPIGLSTGTKQITPFVNTGQALRYYYTVDLLEDKRSFLYGEIGAGLQPDDLVYIAGDPSKVVHTSDPDSVDDYDTWYTEAVRRYRAADVSLVPVCPE